MRRFKGDSGWARYVGIQQFIFIKLHTSTSPVFLEITTSLRCVEMFNDDCKILAALTGEKLKNDQHLAN